MADENASGGSGSEGEPTNREPGLQAWVRKTARAIASVRGPILLSCMVALVHALALASNAPAATITSGGPLDSIEVSPELNCAVQYLGDSVGEFYGDTACGTLVTVDGRLYRPDDIPAGDSAEPYTAWTTVDQTTGGVGSEVNPYRIVTEVSGGILTLIQTDTYVKGAEAYGTRVAITNTSNEAKTITLYRAGDCYLQDSDFGYGLADPKSGAVSCAASLEPGSRIEQWAPLTPGSQYIETVYDSLWSTIGEQVPFPNTCDCSTYEDNGAGLSWTATIPAGATSSFSQLTAFSPAGTQVADSDGDGFPDSWEEPDGGVDTNGDGTPDLKLSDYGATPDRPDVFVQVGSVSTRSCLLFFCSTVSRRPSLAALSDVQHAFAEHGIRLHIDAGPQSLMNPDTGSKWGSLSRGGGSVNGPGRIAGWNEGSEEFNWGDAFDGYRNSLLPPERRRLFHFALYVGSFNPQGNSGLSRPSSNDAFAGADFMIAHDTFDPTRIKEAGTFMHELGHNLGLSHGGSAADAGINYKPNYPSVMNYAWQFSGTYKNSHLGLLDYSEGTLEPLDEFFLSEPLGLEPDSAALDIGTKWSCPDRSYDKTPKPSVFNVDWNCDGSINKGTVATNINNPSFARNEPLLTELRDYNDWDSLLFDGGGALGGAGDPAAAETEAPVEEAEVSELAAAAGDLQTVDLHGPEQLSIQAGTSAPVELTITNHHALKRTYDLAVTAAGVTLSGLPTQVSLDPGETLALTPMLTAGQPNSEAFFEIDASSDSATDADSAIAEVFVVAHEVSDQPRPTTPSLGASENVSGSPSNVGGSRATPHRHLKCRKHFHRKKVHGKFRCVKTKRHHHSKRRHHHSKRR